ncbi:MAG TPA: hypothetical protein VMF91_02120 [Bryobacteraceae bacterium]|nr:hypothetical protein [Bryobacteraceae bacterium]
MDTNSNAIPSSQQIAERGEAIYWKKYAKKLEGDAGKFVAINIRTEEATISETAEGAVRTAMEKDPSGFFHLIRIGKSGAMEAGWYMSHAR